MGNFIEVINGRCYLALDASEEAQLPDTVGEWINVTQVSPMPYRNWLYANGLFSPPVFRDYALVEMGIVKELMTTEWLIIDLFVPGMMWLEITGVSPQPEPGWLYADHAFSPPPPPPNTAPQTKLDLMAFANVQISILTDAVDPDIVDPVNPADVALLLEWKKYRQELRSVNTSVPPVTWPKQPAPAYGAQA